jgi:ABC-type nickel/cobalt efflux system permease component RcnA
LFGIIASTLHVVAGPDHLAAVGPLAVRAKSRSWLIGMSWGLGHVAGMLLLGLIFFFFKELFPIEFISKNSERIVGLLLILIGLWALFRIKGLRSKQHMHDHKHQDDTSNVYVHRHSHDHDHIHKDGHQHDFSNNHKHEIKNEKQSYWVAAGIGIIHGFAGVSHIISMLPTLAFESNYQSIMYLTGFAFGTIFAMIAFSFLLGLISGYASERKKDNIFIGINIVVGTAAIIIGLIWIYNTW